MNRWMNERDQQQEADGEQIEKIAQRNETKWNENQTHEETKKQKLYFYTECVCAGTVSIGK